MARIRVVSGPDGANSITLLSPTGRIRFTYRRKENPSRKAWWASTRCTRKLKAIHRFFTHGCEPEKTILFCFPAPTKKKKKKGRILLITPHGRTTCSTNHIAAILKKQGIGKKISIVCESLNNETQNSVKEIVREYQASKAAKNAPYKVPRVCSLFATDPQMHNYYKLSLLCSPTGIHHPLPPGLAPTIHTILGTEGARRLFTTIACINRTAILPATFAHLLLDIELGCGTIASAKDFIDFCTNENKTYLRPATGSTLSRP